jgi:hypothetical protein
VKSLDIEENVLPGHVKVLIAYVFLFSFGSGPENGLAHVRVIALLRFFKLSIKERADSE